MVTDLTGNRFGKLTVVSAVGTSKRGKLFTCLCDCGNIIEVAGKDLRSGNNKSCGCLYLKHGMTGTRPYRIWSNMKKRCNNINSPDYPRYGGRGIKHCGAWSNFEYFWEDMKMGYSEDLTLDRKNVDGDYAKENCRWATIKEQENNRTNNLVFKCEGENLTLSQIAKVSGKNYSSIQNRIRKGMQIEEAVNIPAQEQITFNGKTKSVKEYAKEVGLTYHQLKKRLMRGWSIDRALTQSLRKR